MGLPNAYTQKPGSIKECFAAILRAGAPERFNHKFLTGLGFAGTNDRTIITILKELGFLDSDGIPQDRYHMYLDASRSKHVLAEGIREAYSDLFDVNKTANALDVEEVKNKLRTLYKGSKNGNLIGRIAATFVALCAVADFKRPEGRKQDRKPDERGSEPKEEVSIDAVRPRQSVGALQYHINIVMPESKDQAVYGAIFRSMREHLG